MKILFVVHQFFPKWYTGTERLVLNLAKQMQRMGHCVEVLTYGIQDDENFSNQDNMMCKRFKFQGVSVISIRHLNVPESLSFDIFDESIRVILNKIITKEKYDIMHVVHPMRHGYAIKVAHSISLPIVLTLTDFWLLCPKFILVTSKGELCKGSEDYLKCIENCYGSFFKNKLHNRIKEVQDILRTVDCVVSGTNFLIKMFELNNFSSNIKLIRFGTDYNNVRSNLKKYSENSEITIGFLSTLIPHKGAAILIDAFNKINLKNIRLKIYGHYFGEKEYYETIKKMVNNNKKVEFYGEYKYEELPDIFNEIDIVVVPSLWWENSPLILLGALAHNVPAIVSNLDGMTEIIKDGENGFSFDVGNVESLAKVLQKISNDPTILNELKAKICHPPRIEEEAFEYEKIYSSLIERNQ